MWEGSRISAEAGWNYIQPATRSSHYAHHQDEYVDEQRSPLGLILRKTPSLVNLIECAVYHKKEKEDVEDFSSSPVTMSEKLKASNFAGSSLKIGEWEVTSKHDGNLVAKCYYAKRKLVWEILDGPLKSKIEIQWSDIIGIKATIVDNQPAILEIELNQAPLFYRETNPQPRKHTIWQQSYDFTGGQASICRRHCMRCPPGAVDKTYEKILLCDPRLNNLSRRPFPSRQSLYFDQYVYETSQLYVDGYGQIPQHQGLQSQYQNYPQTFVQPQLQNFNIPNEQHCASFDSNSSLSVMSYNGINDQENNYDFTQLVDEVWTQQHVGENVVPQGLSGSTTEFSNLFFPEQQTVVYKNYDGETEHGEVTNGTENLYFEEGYQMSPSSEHILFSLLNPLEGANIYSNAFVKYTTRSISSRQCDVSLLREPMSPHILCLFHTHCL